MAWTKALVIGSTALVDRTLAFFCWRMNRSPPSRTCSRRTMTFKFIRSMDCVSRTTCWFKISATVCGSFDFGSACGVPLRPGDRLTVVPLMEVIEHLPSHARKRSRSCLLSEQQEAGAKTIAQGERTACWSAASSKKPGRRRSCRASARRVGRQRAARSPGEDDRAGRAHGVLVGPREERDAREGNRRCPFLALRTVRFSQVRSTIIYMLVGLRRSLAGVVSTN